MITNITLENFKCFRQVSINPKLLTVLIGPNGTGKSSVLQALLLLKQSAWRDASGRPRQVMDYSIEDVIVPKFLQEPIATSLKLETHECGDEFHYSESYPSGGDPALRVTSPKPDPKIRDGLTKLRMVPAVRGLTRPKYRFRDTRSSDITLYDGLSEQEEQIASNLGYTRSMEEELSELLRRVTGTGMRLEPVPPQSVQISSVGISGNVNIIWEGFGSNALIPLFLQLLSADKEATVLIEEPEIHLHPKAQADLAEVMAETAKAEDKQIIMTTHSEYVAGRLLTLVAEGKLTTDELAIYSFEKDERGECFATEIEVTERGQTKGGLTGFDEATRDEMRRYADGLRKHT